jgi:hypothetical protein
MILKQKNDGRLLWNDISEDNAEFINGGRSNRSLINININTNLNTNTNFANQLNLAVIGINLGDGGIGQGNGIVRK